MRFKFFKSSLFISVFLLGFFNFAQQKRVDASSVVSYLLDHQKENGAFGPQNKEYTDLAWNYPAIYTLKILGANIPREKEAFKNGNKSWIEINSRKNGPWYWSFYQKANLYHLYNVSDINFESGVKRNQTWEIKFKPRKGYLEFSEYKKGFFFNIASLWHMLGAISLLDGHVSNKGSIENYLLSRQANNGAFVDDVSAIPTPTNKDANLVITSYAILVLKSLGKDIPNSEKCIQWLQACQTSNGGFKYNPDNKEISNKPDVWYTWCALQALQVLGAKPKDSKKCAKWLNSLQNYDGGFADRPGWKSRIYSTYYAVSSLHYLTGNANSAITQKKRVNKNKYIPEGKYSIYQAFHKSPVGGNGMIDSIVKMNINLIGVKTNTKHIDFKNGISAQVTKNKSYVKQKNYKLEVLELPENYSHKLTWNNNQKADHISNFLVPPNLSYKQAQIYNKAFNAGKEGLSWIGFKTNVIRPIRKLSKETLFYPELDYSMINAYQVYDEGLDFGYGYNAVPGAHFGNIDWVRHFPYKERWEGVLPIIADGDAHGNINKWQEHILQFRNIFIAKDYHFKSYIEASLNGRSVCVIRMPSGTLRYYGSKAAINYLKKHQSQWEWWTN
ncbi:prenyltransferase/squalene oxidase repeat-containing protein [Algibacter pectinivorans]|uniref:Geranylgeranyl transferase type II subunit beta n=1 Tax=Algibacter pectinivorans TaxID=870482 RepID=A0A1I1QR50_9FLAO|nr:prenyltransferase/squalene oxidase repeat-containing protein [Algibacter pectinivorans]SFD24482.1 Prenyltransferase and squalene oxidase repeat-containing protein [Algibacter pectinivorans]